MDQSWAIFYAILGYICSIALVYTLLLHPLWHWNVSNVEWLQAWLRMTVVDYYGASLALAGIALVEEGLYHGLWWSLGFLLLGSPVCCVYMVYRIVSRK